MNIPANIKRDAWLEGRYRYSLTRQWSDGPLLVSIMCNPSDADAKQDDPTLLRNIHFANFWGFGGLEVVNPFAMVCSKPKDLFNGFHALEVMIGPKNGLAIEAALARGNTFLCAWGNPPSKCSAVVGYLDAVKRMIMNASHRNVTPVVCLGYTKHGHPKHPLARGEHRVSDKQKPIMYALSVS